MAWSKLIGSDRYRVTVRHQIRASGEGLCSGLDRLDKLSSGDTLASRKVVEEIFEVDIEIGNVSCGADERYDLPIGVGTPPNVPGVTCHRSASGDLRSYRLNAS